jgi:arginine metabolism regulation protein II
MNCMACNRKCDGYMKRIFFEDEEDGTARYRQTLFTDDEREHMTILMTTDVPLDQASTVLNEMTDDGEAAVERSNSPVNIRRGPFSAFTLRSSVPEFQTSPDGDVSIGTSLPTPPLIDQWASEVAEGFVVPPVFAYDENPSNASILGLHRPDGNVDTGTDHALREIWVDSPTTNGPGPTIPDLQDAPLLLKHYANEVIPSMTPFRHKKTPWHVLFLSNVMHTLTAVAIGDNVDSANLTNLYGTLAISAMDLHHLSKDPKWRAQAEILKRHAQTHLVDVQTRALDSPKAFKYKSTVMAILTMVQVAVSRLSSYVDVANPVDDRWYLGRN